MFSIWYHDNKSFAEYLLAFTNLPKHKTKIKKISLGKRFADNPDAIQKILYLDNPDAIITYGFPEKPVLGIEFCAEAPSGHDIFQRVARVAASASLGTAFAFIFPEKKWVVRKAGGRWDTYNPIIMRAMMNISRFHRIPALSFFWESSQITGNAAEGYLLTDKTHSNMPDRNSEEMKKFIRFVNLTVDYVLQNRHFEEMMFDPFIMDREAWMWEKYNSKCSVNPDIFKWSPLTSCKKISTKELVKLIQKITKAKPNLPDYIMEREEAVVYQPATNIFRSDPYSGSLVGIDYLVCRNGETVRHRHRNLIMYFPKLRFKEMRSRFIRYYKEECPFNPKIKGTDSYLTLHLRDGCRYTKQKELRIYCYVADVLMFRDAVLY
jgi:hypothetical protein